MFIIYSQIINSVVQVRDLLSGMLGTWGRGGSG
jgi:hypothetical protein